MRKENRRILILLLCGYLGLLAVFTFADLPIAMWIYHPGTAYANVFELIGPFAMPLTGIFAVVSFFYVTLKTEKTRWKRIVLYVVIVSTGVYFYQMGGSALKISPVPELFVPGLIVYAAWGVVSYFVARRYLMSEKWETFRGVVMVLYIVCCICVLGGDFIKIIFGRIRFYTLTDPIRQFRPWFVIQSHSFDSAFPSGHAARATLPFTVFLVPYLTDRLRGRKSRVTVFLLCTAFMVCTWIARMLDGMHYASDVLTGSALVLIPFVICKNYFLDRK